MRTGFFLALALMCQALHYFLARQFVTAIAVIVGLALQFAFYIRLKC